MSHKTAVFAKPRLASCRRPPDLESPLVQGILGTAVWKRTLANAALALASAVAALAACELALRLALPEYERAAAPVRQAHATRIWARAPNSHVWGRHPDTGERILLRWNDWGLRQHRNFGATVLGSPDTGTVNIGVFGDSFVENLGMAAQYSLTEPLDYLLNATGHGFNVLNFGVKGYGTGQSFLHYRQFEGRLDHVFYVFWTNDVQELMHHGLFRRSSEGELIDVAARRTPTWLRLLSKLHLVYLLLDVAERFAVTWPESRWLGAAKEKAGEIDAAATRPAWRVEMPETSLQEGTRVFAALLARWQALVERSGGTFHVVLLPVDEHELGRSERDVVRAVRQVSREQVGARTVDLAACAQALLPSFSWLDIRFREDGHWNESGNRLAARCLYRAIERERGLPPVPEETLALRVARYYAAFAGDEAGPATAGAANARMAAIRGKYLALDLPALALDAAFDRAKRNGPAARGAWDVYADGQYLLYERTGCDRDDKARRFFVHATPARRRDLRVKYTSRWEASVEQEPFAAKHGFVNLDFDFATNGWMADSACRAYATLPRFPLARVTTGQVGLAGEATWTVTVPIAAAPPR